MEIGGNLKTIRNARGYKISEVKNATGVNCALYEKGTIPTVETLIKLAMFYKVSMDDIVFGSKMEYINPYPDRKNRDYENLLLMVLDAPVETLYPNGIPANISGIIEYLMDSFLDKKDQFIIRERFFAKKTLQEVGNTLGISREATRKREEKSLKILRHYLLNYDVVLQQKGGFKK